MHGLRALNRLANAVAGAYRRQIAREDQAMLLAQFDALDHRLGRKVDARPRGRAPTRRGSSGPEDHLEELWRLPARRPGTRGSHRG